MSKKIFSNKYFWWGLGLLVVLIATSVEVFRGRNTNYFDYQDSTRMFWEGLSPYLLPAVVVGTLCVEHRQLHPVLTSHQMVAATTRQV